MSTSNTYMTTEPISHKPPRPPLRPGVEVPWSSGLCDCFSDVSNCCLTCWCPCITFGRIAEIVDKGSSSCGVYAALYILTNLVTGYAFAWIYSCVYRRKMRQQYAIKEDPCWDFCVHCFCERCALCQEYRELQNRGFNMTMGWRGNMEEKNREVAMVPPAEAGMTR